jgi:hypothetical protein
LLGLLLVIAACRHGTPTGSNASSVSLLDLTGVGPATPVTLGEETRKALFTPFGSPVALEVMIPAKPLLKTAVAILGPRDRSGPSPRHVDFTIQVEQGNSVSTVFRIRLARHDANSWRMPKSI